MRKTEDYTPPPVPKYIAFSGGGRTLGSSANPTLTSAAPIPPSGHHAGGKVAGELVVDEGSPTTSLQLRLHDGTRLLARFNLTHTVGDIRRFISHARPDTPVSLMADTLREIHWSSSVRNVRTFDIMKVASAIGMRDSKTGYSTSC